ncbi:MAG: hypothetical protein ACRD2L_25700 [Terriglobia bacterium]
MPRSYRIRANFPVQKAELVLDVQAGSWPAALGLAARKMKQQLKGRRVAAASFTIEQIQVAEEKEPGKQLAFPPEPGAKPT